MSVRITNGNPNSLHFLSRFVLFNTTVFKASVKNHSNRKHSSGAAELCSFSLKFYRSLYQRTLTFYLRIYSFSTFLRSLDPTRIIQVQESDKFKLLHKDSSLYYETRCSRSMRRNVTMADQDDNHFVEIDKTPKFLLLKVVYRSMTASMPNWHNSGDAPATF